MTDFSSYVPEFTKAIEALRPGLAALEQDAYLRDIRDARDEVLGRFRPLFAPEHLPVLSADEFTPFLEFKINRHWSGIHRQKSRLTADMARLRLALATLVDESRPVAERYDETMQLVSGMGKATATAILLVAHPEKYGVWNSKSQDGLRRLNLFPAFSGRETEGMQYAAVNELLSALAEALNIDLWTLDTLWEWLATAGPAPRPLAAPFDKIFADRAQAEWGFDLFADAVERLGGGPDDLRFALTLTVGENRIRLNIGNSMVMDIADRGRAFHLTTLRDPMEKAFPFQMWSTFSGEFGKKFGVFTIPVEQMKEQPPRLQAIYEQSMAEYGSVFKTWRQSNLLASHMPQLFEALFDEDRRDHLLTHGLSISPHPTRYWRITLPADMSDNMSDGHGSYNFWADNLKHGVAAIGFDGQPGDPQIAKFASIRPGDRVVAFLRNKTIGGVGIVTSPLDEITEKERPTDRDFFHGAMWRRIGVDWTAQSLSVDVLPAKVRNKFGQSTVIELTAAEFAEVEKLMNLTPDPTIAREFRGFTPDAFAFLGELRENNTKEWMEANRNRWRDSVLEPMRALFADLGPVIKPKFDPYLTPDALEISPKKGRVLAQINRNWTAKTMGPYHHYFWGAFYRERLSKQDDAQLFINIFPDVLRFGFYVGAQEETHFRRRLADNPVAFLSFVAELGPDAGFTFERKHPDGDREALTVNSADDLRQWTATGDYGFVVVLSSESAATLGPALADTILDTFRRVFPLYLWAVADDHKATVERYLESEFPAPDEDGEIDPPPTPYTFDDFRRETHLTDDRAVELEAMLRDKQQAIFYGPPGTGKTYVARRLGRLLTGLADPPPERLTIVQFHPAYGYEEFIEGIRPESVESDGRHWVNYPARPGVFVRFCRAAERVAGPCVFIIDEINRGNLPRIFGELMLLLEYRDKADSVPLPYSGDRFRIPPNVYLIGTMNTADRSIALVDFALRRRFHFAHFAADPDLFDRWLAENPSPVPYLGRLYRDLAATAVDDPDYAIGPSVLMRPGLGEDELRRVWEWSVLPYLREYHIDRPDAVRPWEWDSPEMRRRRAPADPDGEARDA